METQTYEQAAVEQSLGVNKNFVELNMNPEFMIAGMVFKDYILGNKVKPHTIKIELSIIRSVKSATQK